MTLSILILVSCLALPYQVVGTPNQLSCGNLLTVGQSYMNNNAISATNNIVVRRGSTPLASGSNYIAGETLTVTYDTNPGGSSAQYLFQASNAVYTSGACAGQNAYSGSGLSANTASLVLPNSGDVTVWGGYTTSSSIPVNVLPNFVLKAPVLAIPSNAPVTIVPTATPRPTTLGETLKPSIITTVVPTAEPSVLIQAGGPGTPTVTYQDYPSSLQTDLIVGLVVGIGGLAIVCLLVYLYICDFNAREEGTKYWLSPFFSFFRETPVVPLTSVCLGVISIILVSTWAQNNNTSTQSYYLGVPIWVNNANILAWHPVLMVAGFFFCQVVAICVWSIFTDRLIAKLNHIFFQIAALVTMSFGLAAIVKYKFDKKEASLVSMHSWIGVAAISLYGVNFVWGFVMASLTKFHPDSVFRRVFDLGFIHKVIGASAFNLTAASILTGITDYIPWTSCNYITNGVTYGGDSNPAENYGMLPQACQIANGLGITVAVIAILIAFTSAIRAKYGSSSHPSAPPTHTAIPELPK